MATPQQALTWQTLSKEEQRLRTLIAKFLKIKAIEDVDREIFISPYNGAYGQAGWVIAVQGTPPHGTILFQRDTPHYITWDDSIKKLSFESAKIVEEFLTMAKLPKL